MMPAVSKSFKTRIYVNLCILSESDFHIGRKAVAVENIIVKTYSVKYIFLLRKIKPMVPFFVAFTIKSEIKDQYFIA